MVFFCLLLLSTCLTEGSSSFFFSLSFCIWLLHRVRTIGSEPTFIFSFEFCWLTSFGGHGFQRKHLLVPDVFSCPKLSQFLLLKIFDFVFKMILIWNNFLTYFFGERRGGVTLRIFIFTYLFNDTSYLII